MCYAACVGFDLNGDISTISTFSPHLLDSEALDNVAVAASDVLHDNHWEFLWRRGRGVVLNVKDARSRQAGDVAWK